MAACGALLLGYKSSSKIKPRSFFRELLQFKTAHCCPIKDALFRWGSALTGDHHPPFLAGSGRRRGALLLSSRATTLLLGHGVPRRSPGAGGGARCPLGGTRGLRRPQCCGREGRRAPFPGRLAAAVLSCGVYLAALLRDTRNN